MRLDGACVVMGAQFLCVPPTRRGGNVRVLQLFFLSEFCDSRWNLENTKLNELKNFPTRTNNQHLKTAGNPNIKGTGGKAAPVLHLSQDAYVKYM